MNLNMRRNESEEFVGLDELKRRHAAQIEKFKSWAAAGDWKSFHRSITTGGHSLTDVIPVHTEQRMRYMNMRLRYSSRIRYS